MQIQVALANKEKQSILFLGEPLNFTYDDPGPRDIELDNLSSTQRDQLLSNHRLGILAVSNTDILIEACGVSNVPPVSSHYQPVSQEPPRDATEGIKEELDKLKELLNAHHSTVKKNAANLRLAQVRSLLELEEAGKKRKSVIKFLKELINKHTDSVTSQMKGIDLMQGGVVHQPVPGPQSTQISNVIESEVKEVTLIPSDEELQVTDA
jgi:hypothetical protein